MPEKLMPNPNPRNQHRDYIKNWTAWGGIRLETTYHEVLTL